jgi:hypothetical protein
MTTVNSPLTAGGMAQDPCLASWLQRLCRVLITGNLKPGLRQTIESSLDPPSVARQWHALGVEEKMLGWFLELMEVLGARKKWAI